MNEERRRWDLPLLGIEELTLVHASCTTVRKMDVCEGPQGLSEWPRSTHYHNTTGDRMIDQKSITHDLKKLGDQTINSPNHSVRVSEYLLFLC